MFRKLLINGTKIQNAWAFVVCYITECFEDVYDCDVEISEEVVWYIIEHAYDDSVEFKEAFDYWTKKSKLIRPADTLVLALVTRDRFARLNRKNMNKVPDLVDYMEIIQFGKELEYDV